MDRPISGVPRVVNSAGSAEIRQVLTLVYSQGYFGRPYVVAPGVDQGRVDAIRKAFLQTIADHHLLAEAKRINLAFAPTSGEDLKRIVATLYSASLRIISEAKKPLVTPTEGSTSRQ